MGHRSTPFMVGLEDLRRSKKDSYSINKTVDGGLFGGGDVGETEVRGSFGGDFADDENLKLRDTRIKLFKVCCG